jgi:4-hydroxy-tetrahydrodipicolinate synthase
MAWNGVFPATTTKLKPDGSVDVNATQAGLDRLITSGVSGVIVLPMLGENASLTQSERDRVVTAAKEVVAGRVPLLSGLAQLSTDDAVQAAKNYQRLGAEGMMVFPSLAYRTDRRETIAWYKAIAAASDLPIMIYNNPIAYRVDVDVETLKSLSDIAKIVAIKEETGDIRRVTDLFNAFGNRFDIFCGVDDLLLESVALGAVGWVSGMTNAWPVECVKLFNLAKGGLEGSLDVFRGRLRVEAVHKEFAVALVGVCDSCDLIIYGLIHGAPETKKTMEEKLKKESGR